MFDIAWSEILVLAVLAVVIVGPKDMPKLAYQAAKLMSYIRNFSDRAREQVNSMVRQAVIEEVKDAEKEFSEVAGEISKLTIVKKKGGRTFETSRHVTKQAMDKRLDEEAAARRGAAQQIQEKAAEQPEAASENQEAPASTEPGTSLKTEEQAPPSSSDQAQA